MISLQYSQSFPTASAGGSTTVSNSGVVGATTVAASGLDTVGVAYNASNQSYTVTGRGRSTTFGPADKDGDSSTANVTAYAKISGATEEDFVIANPSAAGLTYTNFGIWQRASESLTSTALTQDFVVFGIPTAASDMPRTGSATYQTPVGGIWTTLTDVRTVKGTGTLNVNFAAGSTQFTMSATGESIINGRTFSLGSVGGAGTINSAGASYSGSLAGSGYSGAYVGRFYGPGAAETGAVFNLSNSQGGAVAGFFVGRK